MISLLFARYGLPLALAVGVGVSFLAWEQARVMKAEKRGVEKEKVRVEQTGRKVNAQAQTARNTAVAKSHDSLRQWYRD